MATNFWTCFSFQISIYMSNEKTFPLFISLPVNAETGNFVLASVLSTLVIT